MKTYTLYLAPDTDREPFTIKTGEGVQLCIVFDEPDRDGELVDETGRIVGNVNAPTKPQDVV